MHTTLPPELPEAPPAPKPFQFSLRHLLAVMGAVCVVGAGYHWMGPGILWTAAHHKVPILYVMHNNRGYHQEVMGLQKMANRRLRGIDRAHIGTTLREPNIDYAAMSKSMGVYAEGPIENPKDLAPALKRAIAVVKRGEPALLDVVTNGR